MERNWCWLYTVSTVIGIGCTEDLASGNTAAWVGLGDLHNFLLSAEILLGPALSQLPFIASWLGLNHKLQQFKCLVQHISQKPTHTHCDMRLVLLYGTNT